MRTDNRLSRMLHVLLHMARHDGPLTSEQIAKMLGTNPVVVRRTMAGLRQEGYVRSDGGPGGGWSLARDLEDVTLLDVYHAVGAPRVFSIGYENENPDCAVEQIVNAALDDSLRNAETLLLEAFGTVALAELARQFDARCRREGTAGSLADGHQDVHGLKTSHASKAGRAED